MSKLTIKPAEEYDKEAIFQINCAAYHDVVVRQFGKWDVPFQQELFERKWDASKYAILLLEEKPVGCLSVETFYDHIFLSEIQLLPSHQGLGFGTQIIKELMTEAGIKGLPLRLRVLKQNRARELYKRLGFIETSQIETHYYVEWRENNQLVGRLGSRLAPDS